MPPNVFHLLEELAGRTMESTQRTLPFRRTLGTKTLRKSLTMLQDEGIRAILFSIEPDVHRLIGQRPISGFRRHVSSFLEKKGLEVGGPSPIFSDNALLPVYSLARTIDNFNIVTIETSNRKAPSEPDFQYVSEKYRNYVIEDGAILDAVPDAAYDFVISSHTLEHFANPIKALHEWKRVLKTGGVMLLCLPHKEGTFDHRRPSTDLDHLIEDYSKDTPQDDLSHLREVLESADLTKAYGVSRTEFVEKSSKNTDYRYLHHHTFVTESAMRLVDFVGFEILEAFAHRPFHAIVLCRKTDKTDNEAHEINLKLLSKKARWRKKSPFRLDWE